MSHFHNMESPIWEFKKSGGTLELWGGGVVLGGSKEWYSVLGGSTVRGGIGLLGGSTVSKFESLINIFLSS